MCLTPHARPDCTDLAAADLAADLGVAADLAADLAAADLAADLTAANLAAAAAAAADLAANLTPKRSKTPAAATMETKTETDAPRSGHSANGVKLGRPPGSGGGSISRAESAASHKGLGPRFLGGSTHESKAAPASTRSGCAPTPACRAARSCCLT